MCDVYTHVLAHVYSNAPVLRAAGAVRYLRLHHSLSYSFKSLTEPGTGLGANNPTNPHVSIPNSTGVADTGAVMPSFLDGCWALISFRWVQQALGPTEPSPQAMHASVFRISLQAYMEAIVQLQRHQDHIFSLSCAPCRASLEDPLHHSPP